MRTTRAAARIGGFSCLFLTRRMEDVRWERLRYTAVALSFLLLLTMCVNRASSAEPSQTDVLESIREHIKPLAHPLADRLPILTWQGRDFPTGLENEQVEEVQRLLMDRGISTLCNPVATVSKAAEYLPVLKYRQEHHFPVCLLPQGWLQTHFVSDRRGRYKSAHLAPAVASEKYPCVSTLRDRKRIERGAARTTEVLSFLRSHGIEVTVLIIDFESGAYLRNTGDREEAVRDQAAMAQECPRCVATFTKHTLSSLDGYAEAVNESRALAIRAMLCDPARGIYPGVRIGNYYAWPIERLTRPEGRWPAYGYEGSGMNVAMPRVYMNAGWGGAGRDQDKMNWNAFYCCLEGFSPAASVVQDGEWLIPWVHVWLGGKYLDFVLQGRKLPEPWVLHEMACHMMLRGAETFAIWMDRPGPFPADYPYPEYAAMGQFVYDLKGVQEGLNEMLQFNAFLRRARPMTFQVPGQRNELGPQTAAWSGMIADDKALVRTIVFNNNSTLVKTVNIFGRPTKLKFGPRGQNFWVYSNGKVEAAGEL